MKKKTKTTFKKKHSRIPIKFKSRVKPKRERFRKEIAGTVFVTRRGAYFVEPDDQFIEEIGTKVFIAPERQNGAIHGDYVNVTVTKEQKISDYDTRSAEGTIREIIERKTSQIVATLEKIVPKKSGRGEYYRAFPDDMRYTFIIQIEKEDIANAADGDKVLCEIDRYPTSRGAMCYGHVIKKFEPVGAAGSDYEVILFQNGIRYEFPPQVSKEADDVSSGAVMPDGRFDLRDKMIFTIDSESAKDLDDAISLEKTENGYLLGVHIADVSHYVKYDGEIDKEAFLRGTSIYFTDKVIPMLPKALSNGVCSLSGGVDRYALSALITLDKNGEIVTTELKKTIINSKVRGVYSELNDIIANRDKSEFYNKYSCLFPNTFPEMIRLYEILDKKSKKRGALELDTDEAEILLDWSGFPVEIVKRERGISEKLIEQFMLCANEAVASWLKKNDLPGVYRVHANPPSDAMQKFLEFANESGYDISGAEASTVTPMQIGKILSQAEKDGKGEIVSSILLRCLAKAEYRSVCDGHFGLATKMYCHFTSPIRRYPDLSVHRIISAYLSGEGADKYKDFAKKSAENSTECELRALCAERSIDDLYKCLYLSRRIGKSYCGCVRTVISSGFFVSLENTCEGFVSLSSLSGYYVYDEKRYALVSKERKISLGDKVEIKIERVNLSDRSCDMSVINFL